MRLFLVLCSLLSFSLLGHADDEPKPTLAKKQLVFAAADWCPYTCQYHKHPGFVSEWLISILQSHGWQLRIQVLPWQQALALSKAGEIDGLVTATEVEAPHMLFSHKPIDYQRSCFYHKQSFSWAYEGLDSLTGIRLGLIEEYAYGEPIDDWLSQQASSPTLIRLGSQNLASNPVAQLLAQIDQDKIDVLIEDAYVLRHFLHQNPKPQLGLTQAACLPDNPFYVAVTPNKAHSTTLLKHINNALNNTNRQVLKEYIKYRYGLLKKSPIK